MAPPVTVHRFPFVLFSAGTPLAATLHRNVDNLTEPQPTVVVSGSWLTVKEQMADRYATELARRGFSALTFDFSGFGRSAGAPRQTEIPAIKMQDIEAAVRFVSTLSCTRGGRVGYLAICASAQYALAAMARGVGIDSFVSVAGWFHDGPSIEPFYGCAEGVHHRLSRANDAQRCYLDDGRHLMVPAYDVRDNRAGMNFQLDYYENPARGAIPEWKNEMSEMSWLYWLTFDGITSASRVNVPTLLIHGDDCALPQNARRVHDHLRGPKELLWMAGQQTDFYDQEMQVNAAVTAADEHFRRTLEH